MYLSELAPKEIRGKLTSLMQLLVTVGIFVAYLTDYALSGSGAWRWMIGLGVVPAVLLMVGIYTQPESPRWLVVNKGSADEAEQVLIALRGDERAAAAELAEIQESAAKEAEQSEPLRLRALTTGRLRPTRCTSPRSRSPGGRCSGWRCRSGSRCASGLPPSACA